MKACVSAKAWCLLLRCCLLSWLLTRSLGAADQTSFLLQLPKSAVGAIEVNDFRAAVESYRDPQLRDSDERSFRQLQDEFGLGVESLLSVAAGTARRIDLSYGQASLRHVLVLEIDDKAQVQMILDKEFAEQHASGREKPTTGADGEMTYRIETKDEAGQARGLVRIVSDQYLILADHPVAARDVFTALQSWESAPDEDRFPDFPDSIVYERASGPEDIVMSWLVYPWRHLKQLVAAQLATPEDERVWKYAQRHGLTGIPVFGGSALLSADSGHTGRAFVLSPRPRSHTLNMLTLRPLKEPEIPPWLAHGVEDMLLLHGDVPAAIQQMDRIFDDLLADGIDGTYREILEDVKAPDGLNIDLERELFPHLGPRVFIIRSTPDEAPRDSESGQQRPQLLLAVETQQAADVAQIIGALMKDDADVARVRVQDSGADVWRVESAEGENRPCLAVIHGYAIYATDYSILAEQLAPAARAELSKLEAINVHLRQIITAESPPPSMIFLRGSDLHVAAGSDRAAEDRLGKTVTPDIRQAILGAFFNSVSMQLQENGLASFLNQITEKAADPVVLGFAHDDGWFFVGSSSLSAADRP